MDTDTEITEQIPVFCYLICVTPQAGETMDKKYIGIPIFCRRMEVQQTRAVHGEAAPYIAGNANDFKAMLFCVTFQPVPLPFQYLRTVRLVVSHTAINPSLFLFHHAASIQKSFIFQTIST
jgi:hypothetical protein